MKNLVKYILFALVAVTLTGCIASDFEDGTLCRDGVLTFDLSTGDTRTTTDNNGKGDSTNDDKPSTESVIKDIQFFLYKRSADDKASLDSEPALFAGKITGISATSPDHDTYTTPEKSITIPALTINKLFESASKCDIYVIVNYIDHVGTDLTTDLSKTSRNALKKLPLTFKFGANNYLANTSFVMDSELMTVSRGTGANINKLKADDIIYVTRAAAKILIEVNVENSITVNGETWEPYTKSEKEGANDKIMTLSFFNGVKYGIIDDDSDTDPTDKGIKNSTSNDPYYKIENMPMSNAGVDAGITNPESQSVTRATTPFTPKTSLYTYTSLWDESASDSVGDSSSNNGVPYFMLTIPWRKVTTDGSATWVNYEYEIPISKTNQFVRNKLYLIRLRVGALGDLNTLDESVLSFNVLDWKAQNVNVSLENPRYLVVNEHNYEMDNVEEILIPYSSSHECVITNLTVKRDDLYAGTEASQNDKNSTHSAELVNIDGKTYIKVNNDLDNNLFANNSFNSNFDIEKYTITLTISHKNADGSANSTYTENIKIIQYPALFGVSQLNSNAERSSNNDKNGFVYVNGYRGTWSSSTGVTNFDNCNGLSNGSVTAQSMYVFTVSSVQGTDYVIGDPRKRGVDNLDDYNFTLATGYSTYSKQNRKGLEFYYPTDAVLGSGESSPTYKMVAPKFRLSSGYGQISTNGARRYYQNAVGRCATYQEDGYPAGRWRLPTAAEFKLLNTLVANKVIPTVYQIGLDYWCAHGYGSYEGGDVEISSSNDYGSNSVSIRCVYDDWYWGSEPVNDNKTNPNGDKFTWGDEPRPTATAK